MKMSSQKRVNSNKKINIGNLFSGIYYLGLSIEYQNRIHFDLYKHLMVFYFLIINFMDPLNPLCYVVP